LPLGVFYHKDLSSEIYRKSEQELLELAKKYYIALIFKKKTINCMSTFIGKALLKKDRNRGFFDILFRFFR
jgi:hypothetical protein